MADLGILVKGGNYAIELQVFDEDETNAVDWSLFDYVAVAFHNKNSKIARIKWTNKDTEYSGWKVAAVDDDNDTVLNLILDKSDLELTKEDELEMDINAYSEDDRFEGGYAIASIVSNEPIVVFVESNSLTDIDL